MDENFPILERLSLKCPFSADSENRLPLTLPNGFLAPNLLHLTLYDIGLPKRLQVLTSTVSLVKLELRDIQTCYIRPRLLVARLRSLPLLEELIIEFSIHIHRPSTERDLLGEEGAPITFPSLKNFEFAGVGTYLESFVAQIRTPFLKRLEITLFNQIPCALPHLFDLINIANVFKLSSAPVIFTYGQVQVFTRHGLERSPFSLCVRCKPLNWQLDCATQICHGLIPTLSGAEKLTLAFISSGYHDIRTELQDRAIDSAMWRDLLRSFIGMKVLHIFGKLSEELSRALQADEVGSDPGFLPNLQSIQASHNLFTSFIDTREVAGHPVQFVQE